MKITRVYAIFLRYFYMLKRLDPLADLVFWPLIDVLLWGLTANWLQQGHTDIGNIALTMMGGLLYWQIIWRTEFDICVNLLHELWARNLPNLFGSPLKISEWIIGTMLLGLVKATFAICFGTIMIFVLYSLNLLNIGWSILPFFCLFTISGWTLGFFSAAFIIFFGQRLQQLAWITPWAIAPFTAIFYPLDALPSWAQSFGRHLPPTKFFEALRSVLHGKAFSFELILEPLIINLVYLFLSILFFTYMFRKRKSLGLLGFE